jgi:hypothetical protein
MQVDFDAGFVESLQFAEHFYDATIIGRVGNIKCNDV